MSAPRSVRAGAVLILLTLTACSSGELTLQEADGGAVPVDPVYESVERIIERNCAPCHQSGGDETSRRLRPAEDDRDYSTCEGIRRGLDDLVDSAIQRESMPPGAWPRLTEEEKLVILEWIDQGACSPCQPCR